MTINQQMIICSNCKTPNPARNLYCQSCGRALIPTAPLGTSTEVTQPMPGSGQGLIDPTLAQPYAPAPTQSYIPPADQSYPPPVNISSQTAAYPAPGATQQNAPRANAGPAVQQAVPLANGGTPPVAGYPNYAGAPGGSNILQNAQNTSESYLSRLRNASFSVRVDGWNDLIEGGGEKADEVERSFVYLFNKRLASSVDLQRVEMTSGLLQRTYQVVRHRAGSVSIYANPAGNDLMIGGDMNIQQKPNWKMLGILGLAALILSFLTNLTNGWIFGHFLVEWIFGVFGWVLPVVAGGLVAGKILKGDIWAMFIEKPDLAGEQEIQSLAKAAHQTLLEAVKKAGLK